MATSMYSGARIRTNMPAQQAYNALTDAGKKIANGQLRLSTGKRINSAADDVAGYITSKSLTARNGALKAAHQAAGDAKNVTGIAMDSLDQISELLTQIKDATAQAAAGALGTDEKVTLAKAAYRLAEQIQFVTDSTVFGGKQLLQGSYSGNWVTGYSATNEIMSITIDLDFNNSDEVDPAQDNMYNLTTVADKNSGQIDASDTKFNLNATLNQLTSNNGTNPTAGANVSTGFAGIKDLDLTQFNDIANDDLGIFAAGETVQTTLQSLTAAINNVNKVASYLGGMQVRLNSQEEVLTSQITNYKSAISRIEDADVAEEQMKLITNQFLQSASLTSLAQANQNPTEFLQLLR
jgi:flagellin